MNTHPHRKVQRIGFSLTELVVVMATSGVVLGLACCLLQGMLKIDRGARDDLAQSLALDALAAQFRQDAAGASTAVTRAGASPGTTELEFANMAGDTVVYLLGAETVRREVRQGDERKSTEAYRLGRGTTTRVEIDPGALPRRIRLVVQRKGLRANESARDYPIVAALGRDQRFAEAAP